MEIVTIDKIVSIINGIMKDNQITTEQVNDDLSGLGMDSISFIQIIVALEETFDCEIPDTKLFLSQLNTVQKMYEMLDEL